jgi:hypothetical protein
MAAREREYDDEDDRPRPKRRPPDEFEEGEPPRRRRPRDEFEDEEDDRPRRRSRGEFDEDEDDYEERPRRRRRRRRRRDVAEPSGAVTALAVLNFVFGGFATLGGLVVMFAGSWFMGMFGAAANDPAFQQGPAGQKAVAQMQGFLTMGTAFFVFMGVVVIVVAVLYILAGVGLSQRRQWGRILAIILGVLNGLGAFCGLFSLPSSLLGLIINGIYAGLTLGVLFQPQYAEEFE